MIAFHHEKGFRIRKTLLNVSPGFREPIHQAGR
jgi:hypothetical protein